MNLTAGQEMALRAVSDVSKSHPDGGGIVVVNGFAGTGKTTILKTLSEEAELTVLAPTGKAALRAKEVADVNSSTIHRWLYDVTEDAETGRLLMRLKNQVDVPANRTIFVDEASMLTFSLFRDLYGVAKSNGFNLVFIGDGFQLPPVEVNEQHRGFSVMADTTPAHYRVDMTEVVRQAQDNPLIRASMDVRNMRSSLSAFSDLPIVAPGRLAETGASVVANDGAVVCHRNATRHKINTVVRAASGITSETVVQGEPLMVLQNNYDLDLYNGEIVTVRQKPRLLGDKPVAVSDRFAAESMNMWFYETQIATTAGNRSVLIADREVFGASGKISTKSIGRAGMDLSRKLKLSELREEGISLSYAELNELRGTDVLNANFGYCLSAHKAQGSEFNDVLVVVEDSIRVHSVDGRRWLYTAITRSKNKIAVCWK